jgi:tannase
LFQANIDHFLDPMMKYTKTILTLLAFIQTASSLSLSDICTTSRIQAALPSDGVLLGIKINRDTVTATITKSSSASSNVRGGKKLMKRLMMSPNIQAPPQSYCNVTFSYTHPGKAAEVNVVYALPSPKRFKNRFYLAGGGGTSLNSDATVGLVYGAVSGITDAGYDGFNSNFDSKVLLGNGSVDWDATYMFGYQALGELTQIGKYLTQRVYLSSNASSLSKLYTYFSGCSDGGREAMSQVQRYGKEYNGVVVGAPAFRYAQQQVLHVFPAVVEKMQGYYPKPCALQQIVNATIEACDVYDGRKDGVVSRSDLCQLRFNLKSLIGVKYHCDATTSSSVGFGFSKRASKVDKDGLPGAEGSQTSTTPEQAGSISAKDIAIAQTIYNGLHDSNGKRAYLSWQIASSLDDAVTAYNNATDTWGVNIPSIGGQYVRKYVELLDLDNLDSLDNVTYDTLIDWMNIGFNRYQDSLQTTIPDLTPFQENGGKLIHYHGESDFSVPTASSVYYRQSVRDAMYPKLSRSRAEAKMNEWYHLYLIPGAGHCGVNNLQPSGPYPQDPMLQMIDWVEKKRIPGGLNATVSSGPFSGETQFLCQWPKRPSWKSKTTFDCVQDETSIKTWTYNFDAFKQAVY